MKRSLYAWLLRTAVVLTALCVLFFCGVWMFLFAGEVAMAAPEFAYLFWPCMLFLWATMLPVLLALFLVWRMAGDIGRDRAFSERNHRRMAMIAVLALADAAAYIVCFFCLNAQGAMSPFALLAFLVVIIIGFVAAVVSGTVSYLLRQASEMQNDLQYTV